MRIQTTCCIRLMCDSVFAIFGIGGHYSPSVTTKLNASKQQTVNLLK